MAERTGRALIAGTAATTVVGAVLIGFVVTRPDGQTDAPQITVAQITVPADLSLGRSEPVEDPYYPEHGTPEIDVLHYGLDLAWEPDDGLRGIAVVTLRATRTDLDEVTLDFGTALTATKVTVDGRDAASLRHTDDHLVVGLPEPLAPDEQIRLDIHYGGEPVPIDGPVGRGLDGIGYTPFDNGAAYAFQEPFGAFTWFPCNDHPSDEALYDARFTVPDGWSAVTSGDFIGREDGTFDIFRWQSADPIATYVVALAFDRYEMREVTGPHGVRLTFWYPDDTAQSVQEEFDRTPEFIAWLEERIGPYPFDSGGVVVVGVPIGMETQEMITLHPNAVTAPILVHELAHMWYGNAVTPRTWLDVWLNEGFAMYLQALWETEASGQPIDEYMAEWRSRDQRYRDEAGPPGRFDPARALERNVYIPPALLLHELRRDLGDDAFFDMLSAWAAEHHNTTQDRATFTAWLNDHTGRDFTELVSVWLDSPTTPIAD